MLILPLDIITKILSFNLKKCPDNYDLSFKVISKYFYKYFKLLKKKCIYDRFIGLRYCKTHYGHLICNKSFIIL